MDNQPPQQPQGWQNAAPTLMSVHDFATASTASPTPNSSIPSIHLSADEASEPYNSEATDDMGQLYKNGHRAQQPPRPDMTAVLNVEQYKEFSRLVNVIMEGMNKSLKELWEDMGDVRGQGNPRITGPVPMQAMCVSVPNPFSPKYAHLFGNEPIYPEGEGPKAGTAAEGNDKVLAKSKPKFGKPPMATLPPGMTADEIKAINAGTKSKFGKAPAPTMPPGMTNDDVKATNAGNKPRVFGALTTPTLLPGLTANMLPLKTPTSMDEALKMFGKKTENEVLRTQVNELRRDSLAHFGKFRSNVSKGIDSILIVKGGTSGNVALAQLPLEPQGNYTSCARPAGGNTRDSNVGRQQHQSLPAGTSNIVQSQSGGDNGAATSVAVFDAYGPKYYPPYITSLSNQPKEKRACILHCMTLILLGLENYSAYTRVLLCRLATSLKIPLHVLADDEKRIGQALSKIVEFITPEELHARRVEEGKNRFRGPRNPKQQQQQDSSSLTVAHPVGENVNGLAAPLVSARLSTVFQGHGVTPAAAVSMLQAMAESPVVVGTLFGLYGSRATAKMTESYAKDIQDFGLLPVNGQKNRGPMLDPKDVPPDDRRLRLTIGVTGFFDPSVPNGDNCVDPWKCLGEVSEVYALQWEKEVLHKTGAAFDKLLKAPGWTEAKQSETRSVAECINTSIWPTALVRNSKIVDNPWAVSQSRAEKAGQVLADMVLNKIGGDRPVTLIGFGAGARTVQIALMTLGEKRAFGLVENAVLMGSSGASCIQAWATIRSVVSGRLVNVFSNNDIILGFAQRLCNFTEGISGLEEVVGVPGVENFNASKIITAHGRYRYLVGEILRRLGWEDVRTKESLEQDKKLGEMIVAEKKRDELRAEISRKVAAARAGTAADMKGKNAAPATSGSKV